MMKNIEVGWSLKVETPFPLEIIKSFDPPSRRREEDLGEPWVKP
jgi:hypothetical protein